MKKNEIYIYILIKEFIIIVYLSYNNILMLQNQIAINKILLYSEKFIENTNIINFIRPNYIKKDIIISPIINHYNKNGLYTK